MTVNKPVSPAEKSKTAAKRGSFLAVIVLAMGIIMPWEGLRTSTYIDIVGVATVCFGQTGKAAAPGANYTIPECKEMLGDEVAYFARKLDRCVSPDAAMTPIQQAVVLSWAYNVGERAACSSTLVRQLNAGAPPSTWCDQLLRWDKGGNPPKPIRGLTNRRKEEHALCEAG